MTNADDRPDESARDGSGRCDPAAVRADDAFVEALRERGGPTTRSTPEVAEISRLVLSWKRAIDSEAFPPPLDELTITRARRGRTHRRMLTPVAAAAAAVGIALSGVALLAHDAHPGDPLWGVTQVVYADHARSVAATTEVQTDLELAQRALDSRSPDTARTALDRVSTALPAVRDPEVRAKLSAAWTALTAQLAQKSPPAAPLPLPLTSPPAVTVVPPAVTVTVPAAPRPGPAPADPASPSATPAPTAAAPASTAPPPPPTSAPAPPPAITTMVPAPTNEPPLTSAPAPTNAPATTESEPSTAAEASPQSTPPPSAKPGP